MPENIEISALDLRYEMCRLKVPVAEKILLGSIVENGIRDPLQGVDTGDQHILLDGFKRYRCAVKLGIRIVPYVSLATDEACGLIALLRISNARTLSIIEQARFIDELKSVHQMTTAEIADLLEKSKAWVSVRSGIINQMSPCVAEHIFAGRFPVYCFMYTLRSFMRLNEVKTQDIDTFVQSVAGKNLSIRDIDLLAKGYFKGSEDFRKQIQAGNIKWVLEQLKKTLPGATNCTKAEQGIIRMLEICLHCMQKLTVRCATCQFKTDAFLVEANLLSGGIIRQMDSFIKAIGDFYDYTQQTPGHIPAVSGGHETSTDCPSPQCEH